MATTYEQDKAFAARFSDRAVEIAQAMGKDWAIEFSEPWDAGYPVTSATLINADGLALHMRQSGDRIVTSPDTPKRYGSSTSLRDWGVAPYNAPTPEASVSFDRPAKQIAGDIKRKVATPYAPLYAKIREKQEQIAQGIARATAILPVFENIFLQQARVMGGGPVDFAAGRAATIHAGDATVAIDCYGRASITVEMTGDDAIDLARWVAERRKTNPTS